MTKKILFLGGAANQVAPIEFAKEQGHYIITCDYLPNNPGHRLADEYHNISTTDKEAVLKLAKVLKIDAIIAYASDPAAPTQAYVANALGLASNPYESVQILSRKNLFRSFLKSHDFFIVESESFYHIDDAKKWLKEMKGTFIVKPVDSSGSKGVSKIELLSELDTAFEYALQFSREKKVIIEEFFVKNSYQIGGDGFIVNGQLVFSCFTNTHFDVHCNGLVPAGGSVPSIYASKLLEHAHNEVQRLLSLLNMQTGALNFEFQYDKNANLMIMEIGPRNGGNLIPELIHYATGVDLVKYTVDAALGLDCSSLKMKGVEKYCSYYALHADKDGIIKEISYSNEITQNIIKKEIYIKEGRKVQKFNGSNNTVGILLMQFFSLEEMLEKMDNMDKYVHVLVI